jgi:hypothetical protein
VLIEIGIGIGIEIAIGSIGENLDNDNEKLDSSARISRPRAIRLEWYADCFVAVPQVPARWLGPNEAIESGA